MHSPDYATEETATVNTGQVRSGEGNISLRWLDAAMKPPTQLPETAPAKLPWHDAANDSLPILPDGLPVELRTLNARSNRLSNLPNLLFLGSQIHPADQPARDNHPATL
ncbi:hypothetical protein ATC00_28075 [Sinorhizobium americanum]|nr:hypothetical protein ATC00_28075 [Sinorhizobium americanum]